MVLDSASTAVVVSEISQPNVAIQLNAAGTLAPSTPNMARVSTMVGALPRLPAMEMMPTSRNETTTPMMVMAVACQNEMPKPSAHAPYDMANMEMLAANQGQNRLAGVPLRSSSDMVSMPCSSMERFLSHCSCETNLLESAVRHCGQAICTPHQRNCAHDITTYSHLYYKS